jgi:HEAT repeat protein
MVRRQGLITAASLAAAIGVAGLSGSAYMLSRGALASSAWTFQDEDPGIPDEDEAEEPQSPVLDTSTARSLDELLATSPLAKAPKTPDELLSAVITCVDIVRIDLAKHYFEQLLKVRFDDKTLLELRDKHGAAPLLRMRGIDDLKPMADKLLDLSNAAARRRAGDITYVIELLQKTGSSNPEEAAVAEETLRSMGIDLTPMLMGLLLKPEGAALQSAVFDSLARINSDAVPQLQAALDADAAAVRLGAVQALGRMRARHASVDLWAAALGDPDSGVREAAIDALVLVTGSSRDNVRSQLKTGPAAAVVLQRVRDHYARRFAWRLEPDGRVNTWIWHDSVDGLVQSTVMPDEASDVVATRMARQLLAASPSNPQVQAVYMGLLLTRDSRLVPADQPLPTGPGTAHDLALTLGADLIGKVLTEALATGRNRTAAAAIQVLEQIGSPVQLRTGPNSPFSAALYSPDLRVQLAAAHAILKLDPAKPFSLSTQVMRVLNRAAMGDPVQRAVVCDVDSLRATRVAGVLGELGYSSEIVLSGREAFQHAAEEGDVTLVCLHPNIIRWPLSETVANLRADVRSKSLPILIYGSRDIDGIMRERENHLQTVVGRTIPSLRSGVRQILTTYSDIEMIEEPTTAADIEELAKAFMARVRTLRLSPAERGAYQKLSVDWLARIAERGRGGVFDLTSSQAALTQVVSRPELAQSAVIALGSIGTAVAQELLADASVAPQNSDAVRKLAAEKLATHIKRHGLLLREQHLERLRAATAELGVGADVSTALHAVIGVLQPTPDEIGRRLLQFGAKPDPVRFTAANR